MVQSILDAQRRKKFNSISAFFEALSKFTPNNNEDLNKKVEKFEFTKSTDPLIDEYFEYVAITGQTSLSWDIVRPAFIWKLQTVMNDMHLNEIEKLDSDHICKEELVKKPSIEASKTFILEKAKSFDGIPFTIQRLCELITTPTRHYSVTEKYLHALEKNINVVTTVTETGERITGVDDYIMDNSESPIPVEQNFIVSVDELDAPITTNGVEANTVQVSQIITSVTTNGVQKNQENQSEEDQLL